MARRYWLMKSEPGCFSLDDLEASPGRITCWDGVRNYQARNMLRDDLKAGDGVLFYHSNTKPVGVVGLCEVVRAGYPDPTAFDPRAGHFDPKSDPARPTWYVVDVRFVRALPRCVTLDELKRAPGLEDMKVVQRGQRLSVQPVTRQEWDIVLSLAEG
ncbi:MAG: EVE domain-containing protein [Nitrospirae bacterium]|nr:EVE domain-containing protein [Nitrospirota bacterium]